MARPLRIVDLTRMYPGACCTLLLADLGADVVKVESPGAGDGLRALGRPVHAALNRGKRSIALDLRRPGAERVLRPLVRWADAVLESHRPGQLDELGLGYEAMRAENPALVWCSITGFGTTGPNVEAPGHDLTFLGTAGVLDRLADGPSTPPALTISLPLAASMAATGVLAALLDARAAGVGRAIEVNMTDSAMWLLAEDVARAANEPGPGWGAFAARNVYRCADGREVTVAATEPRTWARLCAALGADDLAAHRLGVDDEAPVIARVGEVFATKPASSWLADPGYAGGVGPVNAPADLLAEPQVTGRGTLVALEGTGERVLANPIRPLGGTGSDASSALRPPPELGADTDAVLRDAGLPDEEIAALRADGVLG